MRPAEDDVRHTLAALNNELATSGDHAAIRYAAIEPDPVFDGGWLVLVVWELPDPPGTGTSWPLEEIDRYCALSTTRLEKFGAVTECLFRTRSELQDGYYLGTEVA